MSFGADLDQVFEDLAVDVTHASGTLRGVMRYSGANALGISGQSPTVLLRSSDADGIATDDELVVTREELLPDPLPEVFRVASKRRSEDARVVECVLVSRGYRVDFSEDAGEVNLGAIYIDQQYPEFPVVQEDPPGHDPGVRLRNQGAGRQRRGLLSFGPLIAPGGPLPSSARILDATLYAVSEAPQAGAWAVYRVLQSMQLAAANWLVYRRGSPWATAGCGTIGIDYASPALSTDAGGFPAGEFVLASGAAFAGVVEATKASTCRLLLRKTGTVSPDELVFVQGGGLRLRVLWSAT